MDTDPYQSAERELCHTRETLNLLARMGFSACILTKSELIIRDIDLLSEIGGASAGLSFAFHDDSVRSLFENKAPSNDKKIFALRKLHEAGIETYALISPIMPFLTDADRIIDVIKDYAHTIWLYRLDVNSENSVNWQNIRMILQKNIPEILNEFKEISFSSNHPHWDSLRRKLRNRMSDENLNLEIRF
jgi:DNA repair photolyase